MYDANTTRGMEIAVPISPTMKLANLVVVVVPFLALLAAPFFVWGWGVGWADLGLFAVLYLLSGLGITAGFHRLFTHRSFDTYPAIEFIFAVFGSMAVQGPLLKWVALHRRHHQHSDMPDDPHSPHHHAGTLLGLLRGAWHAHVGWLFLPEPPNLRSYVPDLSKSWVLDFANRLFPVWALCGLLIPAVAGGLMTLSWMGALTGLIWGGLVRIFLVHHVTWSVNSACHLWGRRTFPNNDQSRDNLLFGVLAMGEGWHNSHHAFPTSARHGLRWWQFDLSYWVIRGLALVGLAWNVRLPTKALVLQRRAAAGPQVALT